MAPLKYDEHDYKKYPELTNRQLAAYGFMSPHFQLEKDFWAKVVKVIDGDTIRVTMEERDFDFPVRLLTIAAPEMNEEGGEESRKWLAEQIMGEEVKVLIDPFNRVGKWGRLLGTIIHMGLDINEMSMQMRYSVLFEEGKFLAKT